MARLRRTLCTPLYILTAWRDDEAGPTPLGTAMTHAWAMAVARRALRDTATREVWVQPTRLFRPLMGQGQIVAPPRPVRAGWLAGDWGEHRFATAYD